MSDLAPDHYNCSRVRMCASEVQGPKCSVLLLLLLLFLLLLQCGKTTREAAPVLLHYFYYYYSNVEQLQLQQQYRPTVREDVSGQLVQQYQ